MHKLLVSALLIPALVLADTPSLPLWKEFQISGTTYACYDFDGAKKLKLFATDCTQYTLDVAELRLNVQSLIDANTALEQAYNQELEAKKEWQALATDAQNARDQAMKESAVASGNSVLGGGFPWLIAAAAVGAFAGAYVTYRVTAGK